MSSLNKSCNAEKIVCAEMVHYCFESLLNHLNSATTTNTPSFPNHSHPIFVTWSKNKRLRGCIGTFSAVPLHCGLQQYALNSATMDSRFNSISKKELHNLNCSVSLLTKFEEADDWMDWEIGKHGVRIEFWNENGHKRTATYLPEIAHEQGWDHTQTIDSLLEKGGYRSEMTSPFRDSIKLTRYQSETLNLTYEDHLSHLQKSSKLDTDC